jgi:hypothetical protein
MPPAAGGSSQEPSNEYVLNVAFFSFLGFVMVQAVFALIARSEAMLADSEAMMVDALTYLFNLVAERIKNRPLQQESELMLAKSAVERHYDRELQRLYLELVPPSVSVLTLVAVTCMTLREASATLRTMGRNEETGEEDDEESVSLPIMLVFSAANLLLDIVNVSCFARANMNFGLDMVRREQYSINEGLRESSILRLDPENPTGNDGMRGAATEATALLEEAEETSYGHRTRRRRISSSDLYNPDKPQEIVNLNMCSAWTVRSSMSHDDLGLGGCIAVSLLSRRSKFLVSHCLDLFI